MLTPEGNSTAVLVPSKENRAQAQAYQDRLRVDRQYQRDLISAMRANPEGNPADIQEAAMAARGEGAIPPSLRAQGLARSEMDRRRQNMMIGGSQYRNADNVGQIRQLLALRDRNPEAYDELLADNMGPRDIEYSVNPRTGQIQMRNTRAYPPADRGADTQVDVRLEAMDRQERQRQEENDAELRQVAVTARDHPVTFADLAGYSRYEQARAALERKGATPAQVQSILADVFPGGPGGSATPRPPSTPGRSRTRRSGPTPRG